jgi:hypothetical protein
LRRYAVWAGTRALVTLGTSVEPSMRRQVRMKMTAPTGGTPHRATYSPGMPRQSSVGGGRSPRNGKCWTQRIPVLTGVAWIAGAHVLARNLAVAGLEIDDRALPARLGNGAEFHVVSGTRLPRCWFPHPQSGGCGNHRLTGASDASRIKCRHVERSRTLPPIVPALPWRTSVGSCTYIVSREHTRKAEPSQSFSLRKASRTTPQLMLSPLRLSAVK